MPELAAINVSSGGGGGSDDMLEELRAIRNALENMDRESTVQNRLGLGGAAGGGLLARILGFLGASGVAAGAGAAGAAGGLLSGITEAQTRGRVGKYLAGTGSNFGDDPFGDFSDMSQATAAFEKVLFEGKEKIAILNERTESIVELLSLEEAEQIGIVDEKGEIKSGLKTHNTWLDEANKGAETYQGMIQLNIEESQKSQEELQKQAEINKQITQALNNRLRDLTGRVLDQTFSTGIADSSNLIRTAIERQSNIERDETIRRSQLRQDDKTGLYLPSYYSTGFE